MKIALCFWGLTRSLKYTIHSIKKYILHVFKKYNIEYKIFIHTFKFDEKYNNPRTNEINIELDFEEYKLLDPDYIEIDHQDEVKTDINVFKYRTNADPWKTEYISVDNFLNHNFLNHKVSYEYGMLQEECSQLMKKFFSARRP